MGQVWKAEQKVVDMAHAKGITVEGELGCLGGIEDGHGAGMTGEEALKHLTDPEQAEQFVAETGVDALAVAIGTSHGAYKFTRKPTGDVLKMDVIQEIHKRLPNAHLVMHGSSAVPDELTNIIRQYGVPRPTQIGPSPALSVNVPSSAREPVPVRRGVDAERDNLAYGVDAAVCTPCGKQGCRFLKDLRQRIF